MKKTISVILLIAITFAAGACTSLKKETATPPAEGKLRTVTVGLMPDVESIPFIIAQEKGYFKEEGLDVKLEFFKSAVDRDSALQSGNLDGAVSDMLAEVFAKAGGFDMVITSMTSGSYKMVIGKDITATTIQELKGRDVAISKNTIIEYVTDRMLAEGGLKPDDINKIIIPQIPARLEMLQNGKIAAATMPEPLASLAVKNGAKLLRSSDQLGLYPGVMVFTRKAVTEKEKELQALYRAYSKSIEYLAREPLEKDMDMLVEKAGFPPGVKGVLVLPKYQKAVAPKIADVETVINWMLERKLIQKPLGYQDLVDDRFTR
ncbi:MAG TPA: MetQ/NlpA family ABC transporter substrate-binding protein [Patescibacteria group bacterium]|nr:MetQ/NlpA family ABC transporter substrate-binding protein [Patescibacteria group bacterium]